MLSRFLFPYLCLYYSWLESKHHLNWIASSYNSFRAIIHLLLWHMREKPWGNLLQEIKLPTVLIKSVTLQSICTSSSPITPCQLIHLNLKRDCVKDRHASLCEFPQAVHNSKYSLDVYRGKNHHCLFSPQHMKKKFPPLRLVLARCLISEEWSVKDSIFLSLPLRWKHSGNIHGQRTERVTESAEK